MFSDLLDLLKEMIEKRYVNVQKHPSHEIFIYNYSSHAQYDKVWNEVTLQCRGLILDKDGKIIARPFKKFFNLGEGENQDIPKEAFEVYEKMDGSLGILYWVDDEPFIATRGSFTSDQAVKASEMLKSKYAHTIEKLDKNKTYLFEIIYPKNRIIIDYGEREELVLLAVIEKETGEEHPLEDIGFPLVKHFDGLNDIHKLSLLEESNREGFVIKFKSGLRYKIKFNEYMRIHRLISEVSNVSIWESLKTGQSLDELLDRIPDEFYEWVKKTNSELLSSFRAVEEKAKSDFKILETRKETAVYFLQCKYPTVLFSMLDKKDYKEEIWKLLRPEYKKPFSIDENS